MGTQFFIPITKGAQNPRLLQGEQFRYVEPVGIFLGKRVHEVQVKSLYDTITFFLLLSSSGSYDVAKANNVLVAGFRVLPLFVSFRAK